MFCNLKINLLNNNKVAYLFHPQIGCHDLVFQVLEKNKRKFFFSIIIPQPHSFSGFLGHFHEKKAEDAHEKKGYSGLIKLEKTESLCERRCWSIEIKLIALLVGFLEVYYLGLSPYTPCLMLNAPFTLRKGISNTL